MAQSLTREEDGDEYASDGDRAAAGDQHSVGGAVRERYRLKQQLRDTLVDDKQYLDKGGVDMPEIRDWKWNG